MPQWVVRHVRIRVHLVRLSDGVALEEAPEFRGVCPRPDVVEAGLGVELASGEEAGVAEEGTGFLNRGEVSGSGFGVRFPEGGVGVFEGRRTALVDERHGASEAVGEDGETSEEYARSSSGESPKRFEVSAGVPPFFGEKVSVTALSPA